MPTYLIPSDESDHAGKFYTASAGKFYTASTYDVMVTVGAPSHTLVESFLNAIERDAVHDLAPAPNTYAIGHGRWGEERESSGFLLWTDLTLAQVRAVKRAAITAGNLRHQEAVGVAIIPAGSALVTLDKPFLKED